MAILRLFHAFLISSALGVCTLCQPSACAQTAKGTGISDKVALSQAIYFYKQRQYAKAQQMLEELLGEGRADCSTCYYAALSNRMIGNEARAIDLFNYVATTFPLSEEAVLAKAAIGATEFRTQEGLSHIAGARKGTRSKDLGGHPFSAEDIARDGPNGVNQGSLPNCWFESSLAALAEVPRGQVAIANAIRKAGPDGYLVEFSDGKEFTVTQREMKKVRDSALWARILDAAEHMKHPDSKPDGANGMFNGAMEEGMGLITGKRAEKVFPNKMQGDEIGQFIYEAVKSQNPVVAGSSQHPRTGGIVGAHFYSVIDFDSSQRMVVLRNPWGSNPVVNSDNVSRSEVSRCNAGHGVIRIPVSQFQADFPVMARSFI